MERNDEILKDNNLIKDYNGYEKILDNFYNLFNVRKLDYDLDNNKIKNLKRNVILRNGKIVYGSREIQKDIKPQLIDYSMNQFEFSKDKYEIYKQFIYYIKTIHKKDVILLLSPYHYTSYKLTLKRIPYYLKMEKKFEKLSEDLNIKIIGSYNPLKIKCEEKEFVDHMHPKESCMIKIINQIN